ncbi:MAG TPA: lectin, partial [Gammaproteobacteria bacterium]|nr:lectin [Gammaproteobacteria bacterium]
MAGAAVAALCVAVAGAQNTSMSFFITSVGKGDGANLGGLAGADAHCQQLGAAAGQGGKTWHAYLSTSAANGQPAVNARDRIGRGPWFNAKGVQVAASVD